MTQLQRAKEARIVRSRETPAPPEAVLLERLALVLPAKPGRLWMPAFAGVLPLHAGLEAGRLAVVFLSNSAASS